MRRVFFKKIAGLTLLEMVISIAIFILIATTITFIFNRSLFLYCEATDKNIAAQEAQTAIEWLVRDIQTAYTLVVAQADNIVLVNPQQEHIRYYLDADQTIKRQNCAGQSYLLAEHVVQLSLKYYNINNNIIADPLGNILSIKVVEIDLATKKNRQEFRLNTVVRFDYNHRSAWVKAYGNTGDDYLNFLQQTSAGYISGGETNSFGAGGYDFLLTNTTNVGNIVWAKTYGGTSDENLRSLQQASDGGYIAGGYTNSFGAGSNDCILLKTNAAGTLTWAKTYGGTGMDHFYSLNQTSDGGYIALGYTNSFGAGGEDGFLLKTNAAGTLTWAKTYGGINNDYLRFLQQASDGGYIAGGYTNSFGAGSNDCILLKTNAAGTLTWAKTYGGTGNDYLYSSSLQQTLDGGYIVGGYTASFGAVNNDCLLIKTDNSGNIIWAKTYGGSGDFNLRSLQQTGDGYILGGITTALGAGNNDYFLIKTDNSGNIVWTKIYSGPGSDNLLRLQLTSDGGYIAGGYTNSFGAGAEEGFLIKVDTTGSLGCCASVDVPNYSNDGNPANDDFTITTKSHGTDFTVTTKSHGADFIVTTKSHGFQFIVTTKSHGFQFTVTTKSHGTDFTVTTNSICPGL